VYGFGSPLNLRRKYEVAPGLALAAVVAAVATYLAQFAPILGAPVIAILLGVAIRTCTALPVAFDPGIKFAGRNVLQFAIIISGFGVSLTSIVRTGLTTLPVTLGTIAIAFGVAPLAGHLLRLDVKMRELIGIGTAICGASAIAAVATVIEPSEEQIALSIATIFLFNIVAVLTFPIIGHGLGMTQEQFGVWAGTAINDTSSVVAAGFAYGHDAGTRATIVKLTRATLILPIVGVLALFRARTENGSGEPIPWRSIVPWFILWFLAAAIVNSSGVVPSAAHRWIIDAATFLISLALAAIGLQTALAKLLRTGSRPLLFGLVLWIAVALSSLAIQRIAQL
jgi:uncharacterized integral membrane protein (TIGR00698 family)